MNNELIQDFKEEVATFDETQTLLNMGVQSNNIGSLKLLITSAEDFSLFLRNYWKKDICESFDIENFRLYKLNKMKIDFTRLEHMFAHDPQFALEQLTLSIVPKRVTSEILNGIARGSFTLMTIFDKFMKNNLSSLSQILNNILR